VKYLLLIVSVAIIFAACNSNSVVNEIINGNNKFSDKTLQKIYNHKDQRNTKELLKFLDHENKKYIKAAAFAFASVQDSNTINYLLRTYKTTENEDIKIAVAFAIGQTHCKASETALIKIYKNDNSKKLNKYILEAIGKIGSKKSLNFINNLYKKSINENNKIGILWAYSRFAINGISDSIATNNIIKSISSPNLSDTCKYVASITLSRLKNQNLEVYTNKIILGFKKSDNVFTKSNLCYAFSKIKSKKSFNFLDSILKSNIDHRIKINAIHSLSRLDTFNVTESIKKSLLDSNVNVAITASEYFLNKGKTKDANKYFKWAKKQKKWRVRTNLFAASVKYSKNKNNIIDAIISGYNVSENLYEKANLLQALGGEPKQYKFVSNEVFNAKKVVISTYGMEALAEMRRNKNFDLYNKKSIAQKDIDLYEEFALIFKRAILSGDVAMISIAAGIIRDTSLHYINQYKNTYFLTQALNNCKLPKEIEAYLELQKTISYINGSKKPKNPSFFEFKPDWEHISKINKKQKINIKTSKGDIKLELYVEKTPVTVSTFIKLIKKGFYKDKAIHRVVPNFVVQDGCPRGDGWGGSDFSIRSEFADIKYKEGSIGMASAGKDTESSQWFITHSPTPHLDGRYTNFGSIISGIEIVNKLEVGDKIIDIEVITE